jgi:hypothetical protein
MPEFRSDPEHDAGKVGVMSGAIQLEEIDTEAFKDRYGKLAVNVAPAKANDRGGGLAVFPALAGPDTISRKNLLCLRSVR